MRAVAAVAAALAALALAGCSSGDDEPQTFFSVDADLASYAGTAESGTLTLTGMDHGVVFITLSPDNQAWTGDPAEIPTFFGDLTLNAVVLSPRTGAAVALALSAPAYDTASRSVSFSATALDGLDDAIVVSAPDESLVAPSEGAWGPVTLFVDPASNIKTPGVYAAAPTCGVRFVNDTKIGEVSVVGFSPSDASAWNVEPVIGSKVSDGQYLYAEAASCDAGSEPTVTISVTGVGDETRGIAVIGADRLTLDQLPVDSVPYYFLPNAYSIEGSTITFTLAAP